jgi:hypothetical protein
MKSPIQKRKKTELFTKASSEASSKLNNNMKSPAKKRKKTELSAIDRAFIVKTLLAIRENKEREHLYRPTLKKFSEVCGHSELTIMNWVKPFYRTKIFQKEEEEVAAGNIWHKNKFREVLIDSKIWNGISNNYR